MGALKPLLNISEPALRRLPRYLAYLRAETAETVSAPTIARALGLHEVQVRKDLAAVSRGSGRPKTGFCTRRLVEDIERFLGLGQSHTAVLVGVGNLGRALLSYPGFRVYGLKVVAAFDLRPPAGLTLGGVAVLPVERLGERCRQADVRLGIITVPASEAQGVCDALVAAGVSAVWNFSPAHLTAPPGVFVQNEDLSASLAVLCTHLHLTRRPTRGARRPAVSTKLVK